VLVALIVGQIGLHAAMAGLRMAAPLQALREGASAWTVGVLLALFAAAPVLLALHAGRMADRHGYHGPVRVALAATLAGLALAVASTWVAGALHFVLLGLAAAAVGAGANIGLIVAQRTGSLAARDGTDRVRVFSWLGLAPSLGNVVGPVAAGFMIDAGGFRAAYAMLFVLPLLTLWSARVVPREAPPETAAGAPRAAWGLLWVPGMRRLLFVNWLLSTCWDVHAFAVPILGHERGFTASTIGLVLGTFTLSVSAVRLVVPLIAQHLREVPVLRGAMLGTAAVFALYPLAQTPGWMALAAALLGITLGCVQPMLMSTLHRLTPDGRHGEALAFRSMTINAASTLMPLLFGAGGAVVGAAGMFWLVGAAVGAGSWATRRLAVAVRT
jgi:MFS family permease